MLKSLMLGRERVVGEVFKQLIDRSTDKSRYRVPRNPKSLAYSAGTAMSEPGGPIASVIKVDLFDTHANQGNDDGYHARQLKIVDDIYGALKKGLGQEWSNTVVLTLTEFGRTVRENGSAGTDHGYGGAGLLAGGLLKGSRVVTQWPGLKSNDLFDGRDLNVTIDYRSVCAACIEAAYGLDHKTIANEVFFDPALPRVYEYLFG